MALVRTNEADIAKHRLNTTILAIEAKDYARLKEIFTYLPPSDSAWILSNLSVEHRNEIASSITINPKILSYLDNRMRQDFLNSRADYHSSIVSDITVYMDRDELIQQRVFQTMHALMDHDKIKLRQIFDHLQPADSANVLEFLTPQQRSKTIRMLDIYFQPKILTFLDSSIREEIIDQLDYENLVHFLAELDYLEIIETLENVDSGRQHQILESISKLIDKDILKSIKKSLLYDEDSAGRIMNVGLSLSASYTIKEAYRKFCTSKKIPKESNIIYIYDNSSTSVKFKLIGQIYISDLCKLNLSRHAKNEPLYKYAQDIPCILYTNTKLEEIGFLFKKYFVPEMPVINPKNYRFMGTVNANQAIDILDISTEEEILGLVGLQEFDFHDSITRTILTRIQWLGIATVATIVSVTVIHFFEDIIKHHPILAVFMPIAPAIGGNAATQVLTVTVRAISNREIGRANLWRTIRKEVLSNLGSGLAIGLTLGIVAFIYCRQINISLILGIAVSTNICWAGLVGSGIPILLDKYDKDPAIASVFLTITTDIIGYIILLSLARILVFTK